MVDLKLESQRGNFHFQVECCFAAAWTVIYGPSGAGKSTLLRLLAGLDKPRAGRVLLDGQVLSDSASGLWLKPGQRRTSLATQQPALFPHLSVSANVAYGLSKLDRTARNARIKQALELVDATHLASRRPRELSGGEAQRVALARALAPRPRLLLLDEPFSALDGTASDALLARLHLWLEQNGIQAVLATHDTSDALATAADVVLLREGRLVAQGPAAVVLEQERKRLLQRLNPA